MTALGAISCGVCADCGGELFMPSSQLFHVCVGCGGYQLLVAGPESKLKEAVNFLERIRSEGVE